MARKQAKAPPNKTNRAWFKDALVDSGWSLRGIETRVKDLDVMWAAPVSWVLT